MKLNIISDIHRNKLKNGKVVWETFRPEKLEPADYLIVAGDLGLSNTWDKVLADLKKCTKDKFKDVFAIEGNHDLWDMKKMNTWFDDTPPPDPANARKIDVVIDDVAIFGVSLWAPLFNQRDAYIVERSMNDFRWIPGWKSYTVQNNYYNACRDWIKQKYEEYSGKKRVIVTHTGPRKELISEKYRDEYFEDRGQFGLNATYCVCNDDLVDLHPELWVYGHSHGYSSMTLDGTMYVRNAIGYNGMSWGYPDKYPEIIDTSHWYNTVVEV